MNRLFVCPVCRESYYSVGRRSHKTCGDTSCSHSLARQNSLRKKRKQGRIMLVGEPARMAHELSQKIKENAERERKQGEPKRQNYTMFVGESARKAYEVSQKIKEFNEKNIPRPNNIRCENVVLCFVSFILLVTAILASFNARYMTATSAVIDRVNVLDRFTMLSCSTALVSSGLTEEESLEKCGSLRDESFDTPHSEL